MGRHDFARALKSIERNLDLQIIISRATSHQARPLLWKLFRILTGNLASSMKHESDIKSLAFS